MLFWCYITSTHVTRAIIVLLINVVDIQFQYHCQGTLMSMSHLVCVINFSGFEDGLGLRVRALVAGGVGGNSVAFGAGWSDNLILAFWPHIPSLVLVISMTRCSLPPLFFANLRRSSVGLRSNFQNLFVSYNFGNLILHISHSCFSFRLCLVMHFV